MSSSGKDKINWYTEQLQVEWLKVWL